MKANEADRLMRELSGCLVKYRARWYHMNVKEQVQIFDTEEREEEDQQI